MARPEESGAKYRYVITWHASLKPPKKPVVIESPQKQALAEVTR
jgi:hypothetical protein